MSWKSIAYGDVRFFRSGLSVDGVTPLAKTISFPWYPATVEAVATVAAVMYTFMDTGHGHLGECAVRTAALFRLIGHLSHTGRVSPQAIRVALCEAAKVGALLAEHPHLITEPIGFSGLLVRYQKGVANRSELRAHVLARGEAPARPVLWTSRDGVHALTELTHPGHLVEESCILGHRIGRLSVHADAETPHALITLTYWLRIARGSNRVFSLTACGQPVCTLNVRLEPPTIIEALGSPRTCIVDQAYSIALVGAVKHLRAMFPGLVVKTNSLQLLPLRTALTDDLLPPIRKPRRPA